MSALPRPAAPPRRRAWVRLLLSLAIFVSGVVVGAGGTLIVVRNRVLHAVHHPEDMPAVIAARLRRTLSLRDDQAQQVEQILRQRQLALQEIRRRFQPQVETELDAVEAQISAVLDETQRVRWQKHFEHLRRTWMPAPPAP
ncbi:MAG: hypothetical protein JXB62_17980 [Pirellulales bacterium]|nr:hypothetical protein [Pirellulales bacterium]